MHIEAFNWVKSRISGVSTNYLYNAEVLEIGSLNINGTIRDAFTERMPKRSGGYVGIDLHDGKDVDIVVDASVELRKWPWKQKNGERWEHPDDPKGAFEIVISMEALEHTDVAEAICRNAYRCLARGGLFLLTAAGDGRAPHSAVDGGALRDGEFYRNVLRADLAMWLSDFAYVEIDDTTTPRDIYALAVRG